MAKSATSKNVDSPKGGKSPKKKSKPGLLQEEEEEQPSKAWIQAVLSSHNERRLQHWAAPLVWNHECYEHAKMQAQACQRAGKKLTANYVESLSGVHGQCSLGPPKDKVTWRHDQETSDFVVSRWYKEEVKYDYSKPGPKMITAASNFAQMMWANTTSVGMALSDDGKYCVANYFPPMGNLTEERIAKFIHLKQKEVAPWVTEDGEVPEVFLRAPCTDEAWERHEELTQLLATGAAWKPLDALPIDLPPLDTTF